MKSAVFQARRASCAWIAILLFASASVAGENIRIPYAPGWAPSAEPTTEAASESVQTSPVATYRVSSDIVTLGEIAIYLYGSTRYVPRIAKWNRLEPPYVLIEGQVLRLEKKPRLAAKGGDSKLLGMWRGSFGLAEAPAPGRSTGSEPPPAGSGQALFAKGEESLQNKDYETAFRIFHRCRLRDGQAITPWLYELRTLKLLGRRERAKSLRERLLLSFPGVRDLPELADPDSRPEAKGR